MNYLERTPFIEAKILFKDGRSRYGMLLNPLENKLGGNDEWKFIANTCLPSSGHNGNTAPVEKIDLSGVELVDTLLK